MKRIFTLMTATLVLGATQVSAQRYLEEVFDDVQVTSNVTYGENTTVLFVPVTGQFVKEELKMDVYEPVGDTETSRPVVLYFHTGNFLPHPTNGSPSGTKTDSATVEICTRLAKMGYVVASCTYRLGWNPIAETQEQRVNTLINAAYRGVQDARTAARFFRRNVAEDSNEYGIDPDRIVAWGQGTGGYISLAASTIDAYTDILLPKFTLATDPPLPMVIESVNGDIWGTSVGVIPGTTDTLCYPNHVGYSSEFAACVNMGGALGDLSWLDAGDGPFISFHTPTDPFAPYENAVLIVPGANLPVVEVDGSYNVQEAAAGFGNNDTWADSNLDDAFSQAANLLNNGFDGLYPLVRPASQPADSAPWEWWAPDNANNDAGLLTNPEMSAMKGRAFIDTIIGYAAPRLSCALALPENPCGNTINVEETDLAPQFNVYPNPASTVLTLKGEFVFDRIEVLDGFGKRVIDTTPRVARIDLDVQQLPTGIYFVRATAQGRIYTEKFLKN